MVKKGRIITLSHTAFRVKNVHESNEFYHKILGLSQEHFTPKEAFLQGLELKGPRSQDKLREGFDFLHLGFNVENIEAVVEELESKGIEFIMMGKDKIMEIMDRQDSKVKIAFFHDINGIRCELVERTKL